MEKLLFSQASMSAAAAASSRPRSLNHLTTRRRTVSVRAAKSATVIDRAGTNTGGASAPCRNTPSVTHACRWTWRLRAEPKRWTKETATSRGRAALGVSSSHVAPAAAISSRSTPVDKNPCERGDSLGSVGQEAAQSPAKSAFAWAPKSPTAGRTPAGSRDRPSVRPSAPWV